MKSFGPAFAAEASDNDQMLIGDTIATGRERD
jgi:hypothetical protein